MANAAPLFENFFDRYPQGFCLFLLVAPDKSILFGPSFELHIFSCNDRIANEIREHLRMQLSHNHFLKQHDQLTKDFVLFFAEKTGYDKKSAAAQAKEFQKFFNDIVMNDAANGMNHCLEPIHLSKVTFNGYAGGISVDKKKAVAELIEKYQKENELEPRQKVTLEVIPVHSNEINFINKPQQITIPADPQVITKVIYDNFNTIAVVATVVAGVFAFIPLFCMSIWGYPE